jgi:hypothetical protein
MSLAVALGCQFVHLITPMDDDAIVKVTPRTPAKAAKAREWLRGKSPLYGDDARFYFFGPLVPVAEVKEKFENPQLASGFWPDAPRGGEDG